MIQGYGDGTNKEISRPKRMYEEEEEEEEDGPPAVLTGPLRLPTFIRAHQPPKRSRKTLHGQFMVAASSIRTPTLNPFSSLSAKIAVDKECAARASHKATAKAPITFATKALGPPRSAALSNRPLPSNKKAHEYMNKCIRGEFDFLPRAHRPSIVYGGKTLGFRVISPNAPPNLGTIVTAIDLGLVTTKDMPVTVTRNSHPMQQSSHLPSHIDRYLLKVEKSPHILEKSSNISAMSVKPRNVTSVHSYSLTSASSMHPSCIIAGLDNKSTRFSVPPSGIPSAFSNPNSKANKRQSSVLLSEIPLEQRLRDVRHLMIVCNRILYGTVKSNMLLIGSVVSSYIPSDSLRPRPKKIRIDSQPPKGGLHGRSALSYCLKKKIKLLKTKYYVDLILAYFLQNGGHFTDFTTWRGKNLPREIIEYIKCNLLPGKTDEELRFAFEVVSVGPSIFGPAMLNVSPPSSVTESNVSSDNSSGKLVSSHSAFKKSSVYVTPSPSNPKASMRLTAPPKASVRLISSSSSKASIRLALSASNMSSIRSMPPSSSSMSSIRSMPPSLSNMSSIRSSSQSPIVEPRRKSSISQMKQSVLTTKALSRHNSLSAVYDSSIGSQQQIVERAKQEASVMQKIGDLRKEGLWSLKRLPKVQESARSKAHWDYLLEEMAWLSADFAQERKWKKAAAKKCARMIIKHFQEKEMKAEKAEKEQLIRLKKLAAAVSKEIKVFWTNIEKLVEYKQQTWIDARKKKVLDSHLNFIVDQTEKYSSWLTEGLNRSLVESAETSRVSSPAAVSKRAMEINAVPDDDYLPSMSESDNEDTIAKEEEDMDCDVKNEIELLKKESELPIEDIIQQLPKEFLEKPAACGPNDENEMGCKPNLADSQPSTLISKKEETTDDEFTLATSESDDEETIVEEEKEKNVDYALELNDLKNESELPIEKLLEKYEALYASDYETSMSELEETCSEDTASLKDLSLIDSNTEEEKQTSVLALNSTNPSQEITDIAATAESFQPKGNTLSTTQVCTKVPFLLKHQLREYQHIGLDWLNAMYEKKLNGILADEMGLGKTIQTISLLAHLACEKGVWGPHLIVVPTSVMLNWEMEFKKWCPAFKILTYYGTPKERKQKRMGWTKQNAFHVCITSYKLVVQDHYCFRRKRWIYLILDEAQHIKNFKSQRWQMLLNFQSTHRLLLTGTPLQNNLMELWSLMHFLMPNVFQSHRDFREWFVNPVTGMIEGNHEYNESLIKRLHKVLRPFLLRRLKCEVEKQLPKKYEHIVMCRLSKRQRYLYDDFMSQTKTKETLATGNFLSVINILMQLRKVCNHPNMFEPRPILSPFMMKGLTYSTSSVVSGVLDYDPIQHICLWALNLRLADIEMCVSAFAAHRIKKFQTPPWIIEMTDCLPEIEPPPPCGKIKLTITSTRTHPNHHNSSQPRATVLPQARVNSIPNRAVAPFNTSVTNSQHYMVSGQHHSVNPSRPIMNCVTPSGSSQVSAHSEYTLQLLQQSSGGVPVSPLASVGSQMVASAPFAVQMPSGNRMPLGIGRLVQTSSGQQFLLTPSVSTVATDSITSSVSSTMSFSPLNSSATSSSIISGANPSNIATATVLPQVQKVPSSVIPPIIGSFNRAPSMNSINSGITSHINYNKPIGRVAPLNIHPPLSSVGNSQNSSSFRSTAVHPVRPQPRAKVEVPTTINIKEKNNNEFYIERVALHQTESRLKKLQSLGKANILRCAACPMYGADLMEAVSFCKIPCRSRKDIFKFSCGYVNCLNAPSMEQRPSEYLHYTLHLCNMINTPRKCIDSLAAIIKRFAFVIPSVTAPPIELHVSHPQPSKLNAMKRNIEELNCKVTPSCALLHPIISNTATYFPEPRLIEYDCGKLQRLAHLLWELKSGSHRALIFTQMTRMLDILEQFLSYHGHTYLRLDGSTKIEMRQALMEQFNADRKIFCFILSTRSGGIGVNLTGADTVIFYDSDWNPTMDAQAQDRCHRIGQTRDVHIYRLISEKTIEENILKKANQKRLLGDLAIDGGNFTTAFFKKNTLNELFGFDETHADSKMPVSNSVRDTSDNSSELLKNYSEIQLEQALGMAEEELDLKAAAIARDEAAAEFAEFDESIPFDNDSRDVEEKSPAEEELDRLMEQLTPVEKYAMRFFESLQEPISLEHLKQAEEEIEAQKREWELGRLKALKEEEERQFQKRLLNTDDPLLSYGRETVTNQVAKSHLSHKSKKRLSVNEHDETPKRRSPRNTHRNVQSTSNFNGIDSKQVHLSECRKTRTKIKSYSNRIGDDFKECADGHLKEAGHKNSSSCKVRAGNKISGNKTKIVPIFKPFSNPNLVIRTRRASARIGAEQKLERESDYPKLVPDPLCTLTHIGKCSNSTDISL